MRSIVSCQNRARDFPVFLLILCIIFASRDCWTQSQSTPIYQTDPSGMSTLQKQELSLWDASRNDRWLGRSPENIHWAPDGSALYFQWVQNPLDQPYEELDPWFKVSDGGRVVDHVHEENIHLIPNETMVWNSDHQKAAWVSHGTLYLFDGETRPIVSFDKPIRAHYFLSNELHFINDKGHLFAVHLASRFLQQLTTTDKTPETPRTEVQQWLRDQQFELFEGFREEEKKAQLVEANDQRNTFGKPLPIPLQQDWQISRIELSPGKNKLIYTCRKLSLGKSPTYYMDYAARSGYATTHSARAKVGEAYNEYGMYIMDYDPHVHADSIVSKSVDYSELTEDKVIFHGPYWNPSGTTALVQLSSLQYKDRWFGELDLETGKIRSIIHDHDDAWLGGPPVVGYYSIQPVFMEWINDNQFVFASERSGFAHLYQSDLEGKVKPLTSGSWEVRQASMNHDRSEVLVTAGKDDPCQDHLYLLSLQTGELKKLTTKTGRNTGIRSPNGRGIAIMHGESVQLPDLYWLDLQQETAQRITVSGTENYYQTDLVQPEIVQFAHKDGKPVWAALFKPDVPHPKKPAILHIHGGGYRQFSHKGWSVYGYATHLAMINYLVQEGYTVLDLDYRGSAGFGRDYRTDIYRSMGVKDVESGLAGINYLVEEHGIDSNRIGVYGISYGGFFTLMALFQHPGKFAAGIANAAVSDWAHYNYLWTSRILNLPYNDAQAYQISSPIYHAEGLEDPLLIVHGIIDDNVHFQDAVRVSQKLIELGKDFEVMYYPRERHVIQHETARYDYHKRLVSFFETHLLK